MRKKVFIADKKLFAMFIEAIVGALFAFLFAFSISYVFKIRFANEDGRWLLPLVAGINLVLSLIAEIAIAPRWCRWYVYRKTAFECREDREPSQIDVIGRYTFEKNNKSRQAE